MFNKFNYILYVILLFINIKYLKTFNVNFNYDYNLQVEPFNSQIHKRELMEFFDKASFSFNGFQKIESVPVLFPIDICVFSLEDSKYATTLHMKRNGTKYFEVFRMSNGSYELIADIPSPNGLAMDCVNFHNKGYVAIALNITEPIQSARQGSPIYEISGNNVRAVQYFATPNLTSVYLQASGNDFFLLHAYANSEAAPHLHCPFFKWSGSTFNQMGRIPCSNARQLTPFSIDYESYVAVANYANQNGRTATNSEIYKYSPEKNKFMLFQKIPTNGAVDVEYFNIPLSVAKMQHFLVFGNSISTDSYNKNDGNNLNADSVFYLFDKGKFIPYQKLPLYAVKKFLPVQSMEAEKFILLVACTDQDIKIYNLNDGKFEESKVQFTEGALGKGVSNMRVYQENGNTYLIIANNLMTDHETNIFLPIFKQEQHANALRQRMIEWAKAETQRLEMVNTKELGKRVEETLKSLERVKDLSSIVDIPHANIETVITESLVYPKLHMTSDYWLALKYIKQALDNLEIMFKQKQRTKRDTIAHSNWYKDLEYVYDVIDVKTLNVKRKIKAKNVNGVNAKQPHFDKIIAEKVQATNIQTPSKEVFNRSKNLDYEDENNVMSVKNLQIDGKLNNYQLNDLFNNTLKRKAEVELFMAPIFIRNLKTDTIEVRTAKVNEQNLTALVPSDGGHYVINQDIQFAAPITVNKLQILDRLNNIQVFNGELDVLLKKSDKIQVIQGMKNVTNIQVLQPITVEGQIFGRQHETISPHKFIHEPLVLEGTFMINGDVFIKHQVNALDLIDLNENLSIKRVLDNAIRLDKSLKDLNLKFEQQLFANNSLINYVNQHDMQSLLKFEDDIQVIKGFKVFNDSLEVRGGFCEVKNLNGVDIEKLENTALFKHNNQTIKVPLTIGNITTNSIESPIIILHTKNLTDYLTFAGNQSIAGSLILNNLKTDFLETDNLNTDSKIFNQNLRDIYQLKFHNALQEDVLKKNRKFHGNIFVQNLILNSTINNIPVEIIEKQLSQLEGNIKYVGNFKINHPMNVTILNFQGKLNEIKAEDFSKYWLQKNAKRQVFTAPQTFAGINAAEGILLQGKFNGFHLDEFYTKTYWINRNEYIKCVNFENPIDITSILNTKTLNSYEVPVDVIFKNSKEKPIILESMIVKEKFSVEGNIMNLTTINKINLSGLQQFLDTTAGETLYVENAHFIKSPPLYKTLNGYDIRQTMDDTWLANENVILPHLVEIADAKFEGLLNFEGPINNINLDHLKENYISKTKPQVISVEITFSNNVESENDLNLSELTVLGSIRELKSRMLLNFTDFVQNTLKISGPHIITGNWSLLEAYTEANLHDVLINELNFLDDILHKDKIKNANNITAPKVFKNVHIGNLYANSSSLINNITVADWIRDTVYLYENYTIKGVSTLNSLNVYNNLLVFGNINGIEFNERNLMLTTKNQQLPGSMKIQSYLPQEKRFLTNNIEHLYADYVNGQFMPTFMENLISVTENIEIDRQLTFKNVLKVENYDDAGFLNQYQWSKRSVNKELQPDDIEEFKLLKNYLVNITKDVIYKLNYFDVLQSIPSEYAELAMFSIKLEDNRIADILAISNMQVNNVTILKWMPNEKIFRETKEFNWLSYEPLSLKIIQEKCLFAQQPIETTNLKAFISQDLKILNNILSNSSNTHNYLKFSNQNCMQFSSSVENSTVLKNFCLNVRNLEDIFNSTENIRQIQSFGQNNVVLLTNSSVLIYVIRFNSSELLQKLPFAETKGMALGSVKHLRFLAVLNRDRSHGLNNDFVEIYRSINSSAFIFFQRLKCFESCTFISFSFIKNTNDLLLHILTDSLNKPYILYQYQGVMGFREILTDSTLSEKFVGLNILNLYSSNQQLVALKSAESIKFMGFILN